MQNVGNYSIRSSGSDWLKQIVDPQGTQGVCTFSKQKICGQKKFIFGLKCFQKNEYCGIIHTNSNAFDAPVYSCKFGNTEETCSVLGLAHEDGRIVLQQTDGANEGNYLIDKMVHGNAIFDFAWIPKRNELLTAVADSSVGLLSAEDLTIKVLFKGHTKSVKTVDANIWDTNVFASGGRDCNVIIWDVRCQPNNKANEIFGAHTIQKSFMSSPGLKRSCASQIQNSVISLLFCQQYGLISAGASDGFIKVWDLRKTYSRGKREPQSLHVLEYAGTSSYRGYTSMQLSPYGEKIYVSCLDGKIYAFHLVNPTLKPVAEFHGHKPNTYYAKFCLSPCGSYLLSGSSDDKAYIWLTSCPGLPVASLTGHLDEVTCVAWNARNLGTLVTCSDDSKHRLFKYQPIETENLEDHEVKQNLLGFAVPYQTSRHVDVSSTPNQISDSATHNLEIVSKLSPAGQINNSETSNLKSFVGLSHSLSAANSSVHSQLTPKQDVRFGDEQITPKTSGTKTLLSWLSMSKTPKERSHPQTPTGKERPTSSRIHSKRKLADLMENNRENLQDEDKKPALSPSKNVLEDKQNIPVNVQPLNSVAKMLNYQELSCSKSTCSEEESNGHFKHVTNMVSSQASQSPCTLYSSTHKHPPPGSPAVNVKTPAKTLLSCQLLSPSSNISTSIGSPTANLPNFVLDGRSPHNRRECPVTRSSQANWLTSLSQKRSLIVQETKSAIKLKVDVPRKRKSRLGSGKK